MTTETQTLPADRATWAPIDLTSVLDGTYKAEPPRFMKRTDGVGLLYPGKVHSIQGEPESGKSMVMHAVIAEALGQGLRVLLLDFESDEGTVINRLKLLGAKPENIQANLDYIRPDVRPYEVAAEREEWNQILKSRYSLAVIDGVTEAFAVFGVKSIDNDEVTSWGRMVPRMIASRTGAAVVVVDHVTKNADSRGRFAIGAQAKMSYLTGTAYTVEVLTPIGVGMCGKLALRVCKDRPGLVRPTAANGGNQTVPKRSPWPSSTPPTCTASGTRWSRSEPTRKGWSVHGLTRPWPTSHKPLQTLVR